MPLPRPGIRSLLDRYNRNRPYSLTPFPDHTFDESVKHELRNGRFVSYKDSPPVLSYLTALQVSPLTATDPMPEQPETTLLDDLDARQNAVLLQLDELNEKVERLLKQHTIGLRVVDDQPEDQDPTPAAA